MYRTKRLCDPGMVFLFATRKAKPGWGTCPGVVGLFRMKWLRNEATRVQRTSEYDEAPARSQQLEAGSV